MGCYGSKAGIRVEVHPAPAADASATVCACGVIARKLAEACHQQTTDYVSALCLRVCAYVHVSADGDKAKEAADFAVDFEHRSSDKLKRPEVIDLVAKAVPQPPYKVRAEPGASLSIAKAPS